MSGITEIICAECDTAFLYTDAEREFRESRGLERPTRCPDCRERERLRRNGELITLYQRTETFDPFLLGKETQSGGSRNGRQHDARAIYTATCASCGTETTVPFVPRGDRPVYCRSCYNARRGR